MTEEVQVIEPPKTGTSGGLIGWKCGRCNCQNALNIKICKDCNHAKPNEYALKNTPLNITQNVSGFSNGRNENSDKSGSEIIDKCNEIQRETSDVADHRNVSGMIIKRITPTTPKIIPTNVTKSSNVREENKSIQSNTNQNQSFAGGKQDKPSNLTNREKHRGVGNHVQDTPKPLMASQVNQSAIGRHFDTQLQSYNAPNHNFQPPFMNQDNLQLNGFNGRNSSGFNNLVNGIAQNNMANRGINSYAQELPPMMQGMESGYKMNRWGGPIKDQRPNKEFRDFQQFREEQTNWSRGFKSEQPIPKDKVMLRLEEVFHNQPTNDIANMDMTEKKFNMRARLFLGNLGEGTTEKSLKEMVSQYGEIGETFFQSEKRFAFFRMATRSDAENAKRGLDGLLHNGRNMKVRLSPHQGAIKVSNLSPWVSNELLHLSFSIFGDIERAIVSCDERGQSKEEGQVEFVNKHSALEAVKRCNENCFFLTTTLRPVFVELIDGMELDEDGLQDHMLQKRNQEFGFERSSIPRFAKPESFEFEYGNKWKQLYEMKKAKLQALEREMKLEESKLIAQMEFSRYDHETESLRNALKRKEEFCEQQKHMWTMKSKQMDNLIQREKEKRRALNSALPRSTIVSQPNQSMNISGQINPNGPDIKPPVSLLSNLGKPTNELIQSQGKIIHSGQGTKAGGKDPIPKDLHNKSPKNTKRNNYQGLNQNMDKCGKQALDTPFETNNRLIGRFEQEMNQMFPHLANFNAAFGNMNSIGDDESKNPLHNDPDFGSINPLMQPLTGA